MNDNPSVTIIVRTKDRPKLLKRAIQSIASQTYRPIEVVLVNDGGCDLDIEQLGTVLGDVQFNYIRLEKNTGRAHAANIGIENAAGTYIGFLDDDDELYPHHVSTLVAFLDQSDYKIAYADTEMIFKEFSAEEGRFIEVDKVVFSSDFVYRNLLFGNFIPFNSLCLSRDIVQSAGGFDESLELYEDWDFLIRIGKENSFCHLPVITSIYNQWSKTLQINLANDDYVREMHLKVIEKHREKISARFISEMQQEAIKRNSDVRNSLRSCHLRIQNLEAACNDGGRLRELETLLEQKNLLINNLESLLAEKTSHIRDIDSAIEKKDVHIWNIESLLRERSVQLESIYAGHAWKILKKYFAARDALLPAGSRRRHIVKKMFQRILSNSRSPREARAGDTYDVYSQWRERNEPKDDELDRQRATDFEYSPKISILVPTFNTPDTFLVEMVESVVNQTYRNWELCIADGGSELPSVKEILGKYSERDSRIKIKFLDQNKGISLNSNEALSLASGDYVTLLDHDDILPANALFEVVKAINQDPTADLIYSDEDKISEDGKRRFEPHFKPDWSPDLLRSYNYITHLAVFKRELLGGIGGFREDFEGSQDYDLILRATERSTQIVHIPKILYHWRVSANSAAGNVAAKRYALNCAKKALQEHLARIGYDGKVTNSAVFGYYKIAYILKKRPLVSILIPNKDEAEILKRCIDSVINKTTYTNYEILIIENNSCKKDTFDYYAQVSKNKSIQVIEWKHPFNFSSVNNFAAGHAAGEILVFLNNDTEIITSEWIEKMLEHVLRRDVGAVGAKLYYPDNTIQHAGVIVGIGGIAGHHHVHAPKESPGYMGRLQVIQNFSAVTGACIMVRKEVFNEVNGFDKSYALAFNDVDFCLKLREKNYLIVWTPYAELYHYESKTRGYEDTPEKRVRFLSEIEIFERKWKNVLLKGDPYYNPNLSLQKEDFSLRL
jgi:glycosyltransferase involved in cell wall biosynthesis